MGGTAENRARAIFHQHEIGHIDRQLKPVDKGMQCLDTGVEALLVGLFDGLLAGAHAIAFGYEFRQSRVFPRQRLGNRMMRRYCAEGCAEQRIRPSGEHLQPIVAAGQAEKDPRPFRTPDPVLLHQADAVRPAVQRLDRFQQIVGVMGDLQEPLGQQALFHQLARTPASPVDHLLVGQHRVFDRVPVDPGLFAVSQSRPNEIQEHFLFMLVIFRLAGGDLAAPVIGQAHALQLLAHGSDVFACPFRRMHPVLEGGVLSRQPEGIPAHRMQHVEAGRLLVARDDVADGVVADMSHMNPARRVGKHLQHVIFRQVRGLIHGKAVALVPDGLPLALGFLETVTTHA